MDHFDILRVDRLSFWYRDKLLFHNVSFSVEKWDMVGIIGSNGSWKTTLVKLLLGLLKPDDGKVEWFLHDEPKNPRGKIQYIAQDVGHARTILPTSVEEVVASGAYFAVMKQHKHTGDCCYDDVERALEHVGIVNLRKAKINELSWWQRQRVYIARALIAHPEVLIMDEPLSWIDASTQQQLYILLKHLNQVHGITVIMISHDREEMHAYMKTIISVGNGSRDDLERTFPHQRIVILNS